jgi:DUF438 domain-containing protein
VSELIDNRSQRIRTLKSIIRQLHAGGPAEAIRAQMRELVRETDCSEVMAMEQELLAEGMPVAELQSMCDLHSQVTRDVLVQLAPPAIPPGHPVDTFRRENEALRDAVARLRTALAADPAAIFQARQALNDLMDVEKHYQRKEHALFPILERHGITGPSKVMWAKHDENRAILKDLGQAFAEQSSNTGRIAQLAADAARVVEEMIYKEENILLPMAINTLTEQEWAEIWAVSPRYGWCLVEPRTGYRPPEQFLPDPVRISNADAVQLPGGNLTLEQLIGIFDTLPVDITFVDADDRVAFFSEGRDRIFARSKAVLGRKVQYCHPPKSVSTVDRILTDFREGRQSVAEFWIDFRGRFVHIRYFAVRDAEGRYAGTLEVTQNLTPLRALEGERRLLEYA